MADGAAVDRASSSWLAVTMGDPCGIGPETIARAAAAGALGRALVVGDVAVMRRAVAQCGLLLPMAQLDSPDAMDHLPPDCLALWQPPDLPADLLRLTQGQVHAAAGAAAAACIRAGAGLAIARRAQALVTAPIHKAALSAAGLPYPGHTEMLQALAARGGALPPVRMMLANPELRVVLVTIHVSLRQAIAALDFDSVLATLRIAHRAAAAWGMAAPRIAVAG